MTTIPNIGDNITVTQSVTGVVTGVIESDRGEPAIVELGDLWVSVDDQYNTTLTIHPPIVKVGDKIEWSDDQSDLPPVGTIFLTADGKALQVVEALKGPRLSFAASSYTWRLDDLIFEQFPLTILHVPEVTE